MFDAKCFIDPHSCGHHAENVCSCVVSVVLKMTRFNMVWTVFMSLPVGCRCRSRHGRREGVDVSGAAVRAAIITGEGFVQVLDFLLLSVIPLSMRLETPLNVTTKLHDHNANILTKDEQTFETHADNQPTSLTRVVERERALTQNSNLLEKFHVNPILSMRTGSRMCLPWMRPLTMQCVVRVGDFQQQSVS